jgi:hypothetical protein
LFETYRNSHLLPLNDEVKSSELLKTMSLILTIRSVVRFTTPDVNLHGELVELDKDFMPYSSIFKDGQSVWIHLHHLPSLGIRWEGGSMLVFLCMRVAIPDRRSGGRSEVGGGIDCARGEV